MRRCHARCPSHGVTRVVRVVDGRAEEDGGTEEHEGGAQDGAETTREATHAHGPICSDGRARGMLSAAADQGHAPGKARPSRSHAKLDGEFYRADEVIRRQRQHCRSRETVRRRHSQLSPCGSPQSSATATCTKTVARHAYSMRHRASCDRPTAFEAACPARARQVQRAHTRPRPCALRTRGPAHTTGSTRARWSVAPVINATSNRLRAGQPRAARWPGAESLADLLPFEVPRGRCRHTACFFYTKSSRSRRCHALPPGSIL